jgi:two-component system chemotaxis sensor kinase CheA
VRLRLSSPRNSHPKARASPFAERSTKGWEHPLEKPSESRRILEDLALRALVREPNGSADTEASSAWKADLLLLRDAAVREGAEQLRDVAVATLERIDRPGAAPSVLEEITRLQQALDLSPAPQVSGNSSLGEDPELLRDFLVEAQEHLGTLESEILTLDRDPRDREALNAAFRSFHTIKGLAGFLELWEIQKLAHEVESVLDGARNGDLILHATAIDVVLRSADYLRCWLAHLDALLRGAGTVAPPRDESLLAAIRALAANPRADNQDGVQALAGTVEALARCTPPCEPEPCTPQADYAGLATVKPHAESMTVKVDTAKLDYLVDMAGEMVVAQSLLRHDPDLGAIKSQRLQRNLGQLARITAELQKTAMALRLVPIGPLFRRMARLVRDLARQFQKQVEMQTAGDDIELDRTIVEELADPLMHMVRNALDHGLETAAEREAAGKNPTGTIWLKASHQAGQVVIEITDDGRGLDRERIRQKAIQRELITESAILTEQETESLIFEPGFTTASEVTSVSGRGVGMDVVRRHIEKLRGRIDIRSTPGHGSAFLLKLPLTLAMIDGLVVRVGSERYIVPLFVVREILRPSTDMLWTVQHRSEMALIRGTLLPIVRLYRHFRVTPRSEDPLESVLIIAEVEGRRFCLMVDELIGKQEVVIKSLGEMFKHVSGISGGAILGDGRVGLILDPDRLFKERSGDQAR